MTQLVKYSGRQVVIHNQRPRMHALRHGLQHGSFLPSSWATLPAFGPQQLRCLAGRSDRSWGDLLSDAAELGRDVAGKVGQSVKDAASAIIPSKEDTHVRKAQPVKQPSPDAEAKKVIREAFGGGLVGRIASGIFSSVLANGLKSIAEDLDQDSLLLIQAAHAIEDDANVQQRLGQVAVGLPSNISKQTMVINGRRTEESEVACPVEGTRGEAVALIKTRRSGPDSSQLTNIVVVLSNGDRLQVLLRGGGGGGGGGGDAGRIIDVEFREVK